MLGTNAYIDENAVIGSDDSDAVVDFHNTKICSDDITLIGPDVLIDKNVKIGRCSMVTRNVKNKTAKANVASQKAADTITA